MRASTLRKRGATDDEIARARGAVIAELARRSGSRSFSAFVKQAWPYVMQVDPLVWGWHMDVMCNHLEEVAFGRISKLLINVPPGHAKSVLLCVLWPAWIWTWWPKCQFLFGSYAHPLAERDSLRCRAVIESEWYRKAYSEPGGWSLRSDQNTKGWFVNTLGGERFATGIGGVGRRAHIIGIDDPLDAKDRYSKSARERANDWIGTTLSQRFVDASTGRAAMIMQRLHEEDPSAFVLAAPGWEHLMLPSEYDPMRRAHTYTMIGGERTTFFEDPRTIAGEPLFPLKFPPRVLDAFKLPNALGTHGFATLHQQYPRPEEGGLFKLEDWRFWRPDANTRERLGYLDTVIRPRGCVTADEFPARELNLAELDDALISVDATFKETKKGSFVAIQVWGRKGARRLLLYAFRRRMDFTDTVAQLLRIIQLFPEVRRKLIEGKANGDAIISTLEKQHHIVGLEAVPVTGGNKEQRAAAMQPYVTGHNVELPEGAPWVEDHVQEHAMFPNGTADDQVDCQSQGLQGLEKKRTAMDLWGELDEEDPFD